MNFIQKKLKKTIAFLLAVTLIYCSVNWEMVGSLAFAAALEKEYTFQVELDGNTAVNIDELQVNAEILEENNEVVTTGDGVPFTYMGENFPWNDASGGDVSGGNASLGGTVVGCGTKENQRMIPGQSGMGSTRSIPSAEISKRLTTGQNGREVIEVTVKSADVPENYYINVKFTYAGFEMKEVTIHNNTVTGAQDDIIMQSLFEKVFNIELLGTSDPDASLLTTETGSGNISVSAEGTGSQVKLTFSRTDQQSWTENVELDYPGYEKKICNLSATGQTVIKMYPQLFLQVEGDRTEIEPGESLKATAYAGTDEIVLEPAWLKWNVDNVMEAQGSLEYTYQSPPESNANKVVTISLEYADAMNAGNIYASQLITIKPNPAAQWDNMEEYKNNGVYYIKSDHGNYSLFPDGYKSYIVNGTTFPLPLTQGITEAASEIYFVRENGVLSQKYEISLDDNPPEFLSDDILLLPAEGEAGKRVITVLNLPRDGGVGCGSGSLKYQTGTKQAEIYSDPIEITETSREQTYTFIASDKLGNQVNVEIAVPAVDSTLPEFQEVKWGDTALGEGSTIYVNSDIILDVKAIDNADIYSSGIKQIVIRKDSAELLASPDGKIPIALSWLDLASNDYVLEAEDKAGNKRQMNLKIIPDTDKPVISSTVFTGGELFNRDTLNKEDYQNGVKVVVDFSDKEALKYISYQYDNGEEHKIDCSSSGKSFQKDIIITSPATSGTSVLKAKASDMAGNMVEAEKILKSDIQIPDVKLLENGQEIENGYINTNKAVTFRMIPKDDITEESLCAVQVDRIQDGTKIPMSVAQNSFSFEPAQEGVTEKAVYEITVTDEAGNKCIEQLTVIYDKTPPELEAVWINNGSKVVKPWLNKSDVGEMALSFLINDSETGTEVMSGIQRAELSGGHLTETIELPLGNEAADHSCSGVFMLPVHKDMDTVYTITAYDKSGNSTSKQVIVKLDITEPEISCETSDDWNKEGHMTLTPVLTDSTSKPSVLQYEIWKKGQDKKEGEGKINLDTDPGEIHITQDGYWTVKMFVMDQAGNVGKEIEKDVKIDSKKPDIQNVFASVSGVKILTLKDKILNFFGKTEIDVKLYVQDYSDGINVTRPIDYSDMKSITVRYHDKEQTIEPEEGIVALGDQNDVYTEATNVLNADIKDVYRVFNLTINGKFPEKSDTSLQIASKLEIVKLTDQAGNEYSGSLIPTLLEGEASEGWMLIIDGVAPVLKEVDYRQGNQVDDVYYYSGKAEVEVSILEKYFKQGYAPSVGLTTDGKNEEVDNLQWDKNSQDSDLYSDIISLEQGQNQEIEYQFQVEFADGALNQMISDSEKYTVTGGTFHSQKMIVDTKAPVLQELSISGANEFELNYIEEQYFALGQIGDDIAVQFIIQDQYFNKGNLIITAYKDESEFQIIDNMDIVFEETPDTTHQVKGSFTFDGEKDAVGSYHFAVFYRDNAGNLMVLGEKGPEGAAKGVMQDGTYTTTEKVVINHVSPVITNLEVRGGNSLSGFTQLQKDEREDKDFYYAPAVSGGDVTFTVTVEGNYINHEEVNLYYDDGSGMKKVSREQISWTIENEDDVFSAETAEITVDGLFDGEEYLETETEYRFGISYINYNGQWTDFGEDYRPTDASQCETQIMEESRVEGSDEIGRKYHVTKFPVVVDHKVPELTELSITEENGSPITSTGEENLYFHDNSQGGAEGVRVSFVLDDNMKYFNESKVMFHITDNNGNLYSPQAEYEEITDAEYRAEGDRNNRSIKGSFILEEEIGNFSDYKISISFADQGGNQMVLGQHENFSGAGIAQGTMAQGSFSMTNRIVVDKKAPVLETVTFNEPYQYADDLETVSMVQDGGTKLYYNEDVLIEFELLENYFYKEDVKVNVYKKGLHDTFNQEESIIPVLDYHGGKGSFHIKADSDHSGDGEYYFTISLRDRSGNVMVPGSSQSNGIYEGSVNSGTYTSPVLVVDTTAPELEIVYEGTAADYLGNSIFYDNPYTVNVMIKETNFRAKELKDWVNNNGTGKYGITIRQWSFLENGEKGYLPLSEISVVPNIKNYEPAVHADDIYELNFGIQLEGNYEISASYVDMAGNEAVSVPVNQTSLDRTKPVTQVSYQVENTGFLDFIKYGDFGFLFSKKKLIMTAVVTDQVAGIRNLEHSILEKDRNGNQTQKDGGNIEMDRQIYTHTYTKTLPIGEQAQDFDGMMGFEVYDWSVNKTDYARNQVIESEATYQNQSASSITINTNPSREVDGVKYYNSSAGAVSFTVNAAENYSGIRYVQVSPKTGRFDMGTNAMPDVNANQSMTGTFYWNVKNSINSVEGIEDAGNGKPDQVITEDNIEGDFTIGTGRNTVKNFSHTGYFTTNGENDINEIFLQMTTVSNTGYESTVSSVPFSIDITAPVINVTYNDIPVSNEKFYKDERVAVITITERNFSSSDIVWEITNSEGEMPVISNFTNDHTGNGSDNGTQHVGTVTFAADGDYTFAFSFMDKAGNQVKYQGEPFTIDRTKPEIEITYDNNQSLNEGYYSEPRTATIKITEHNFAPENVKAVITASNNGQSIAAPSLGQFRKNGDEYSAAIAYQNDGDFTFDITYADMAGNDADAPEQERFVVDLTNPEIIFRNIEDFTPYKGSVIPEIILTDTNFDGTQVNVSLEGFSSGKVDYPKNSTALADGNKITYQDFAYKESVDDLYTLKASITDKSGRKTEKQVIFSVNRYGSTYQMDVETSELIKKYYINEEKDLVITETNVDTLEFKELYLTRDGERLDLEQDKDYFVQQSGDDVSWKQYTYTISKKNFELEGVYNVVIYSRDKAENESDNRIKKNGIEFVVDKTAPLVAISGIEDHKQYTVDQRLVTIDVKDNIAIEEMQVYLNGEGTPIQSYTEEEIQSSSGVVSLSVAGSNSRQSFQVLAVDKAGNTRENLIDEFLITSDLIIQFLRNTPLFITTVTLAVIAVIGGAYGVTFRKKKESN